MIYHLTPQLFFCNLVLGSLVYRCRSYFLHFKTNHTGVMSVKWGCSNLYGILVATWAEEYPR